MVEFKSKVRNILPYNRKNYISLKNWYGVSYQLPGVFEGKDIGLKVFLENYEHFLYHILKQLDNGSPWIVNHDFLDEEWFPNSHKNLASLRNLFNRNNIPNTFKGAIVFMDDDIFEYLKDILSYPYAALNEDGLLYNNLDISNGRLQFVIKITAHLTMDLLSTDLDILRKNLNKNYNDNFIFKEYGGTKLLIN